MVNLVRWFNCKHDFETTTYLSITKVKAKYNEQIFCLHAKLTNWLHWCISGRPCQVKVDGVVEEIHLSQFRRSQTIPAEDRFNQR